MGQTQLALSRPSLAQIYYSEVFRVINPSIFLGPRNVVARSIDDH